MNTGGVKLAIDDTTVNSDVIVGVDNAQFVNGETAMSTSEVKLTMVDTMVDGVGTMRKHDATVNEGAFAVDSNGGTQQSSKSSKIQVKKELYIYGEQLDS